MVNIISNIPNIILVDDHKLIRDGIKAMFQLSGIANVIAEASNGKEFLELLESHNPDIVFIDIEMPLMNGIEATKEAIKKYPKLKIIALSMFGNNDYYYQMIEAGACGFVLKSANKAELEASVKKVSKGHTYFSADLLQDIVSNLQLKRDKEKEKTRIQFNDKEIEIMNLMCQGLSTDEIADVIFLSPKTVANYRNIMLNKTGCKNSISLIFYAIQNKFITT